MALIQRKRWEDNIKEWTGLEFGKSQRAVESREKWKKTGCKIICDTPTTLAVKGLMMIQRRSFCKKKTPTNKQNTQSLEHAIRTYIHAITQYS